jgi:hypothetical protein
LSPDSKYDDNSIKSRSLSNGLSSSLKFSKKKLKEKQTKDFNDFCDLSLKVQSKGTNLPQQFYRQNNFPNSNLYKNFTKNIKSRHNSYIDNEEDYKHFKSQDNIDVSEKIKNFHDNKISVREKIYRPILWENINKEELINQKDKLMPKGFKFYLKIFEKENKKYFENNYTIKKQLNGKLIPILIRNACKKKNEESDIFFRNKDITKNESLNKISKNKEKLMEAFYSSDIFNKTINPFIIKKSGEKTFFKDLKRNKDKEEIKYIKNSESTKGWRLRKPFPSLLNYSSSNYNILNPSIKNFCKTKENIYDECNQHFGGFNPIRKQKSVSEFIDLSNIHAPNINNEYNNILKKNPGGFKKKNDMFTEYYKLHHYYYNISEKPFYKFNPMQTNYHRNNDNNF